MPSAASPSAVASLRPESGGSDDDQARPRAALLAAGSALATAAFSAAAVASTRRSTVDADTRLHGAMREHMDGAGGDAAAAVAPALDPAGTWWVYAPVTIAAALAVLGGPGRTRRNRRGRRAGAAAIAAVPVLASALSPAFDRWLPQPPVGPRRRPVDRPVFPSGHAFRTSAVALSAGYVVARERLMSPGYVWPLAVAAPIVVGLGRLVREKHLASDVLGGWLAGAALAAGAAAGYELARAPRRGPA